MSKLKHLVEPERLLLVWQEPVSRVRFAVGEVFHSGSGTCFRYLPGPDLDAAKNKGFKGYLAFRYLTKEYRLGVMESFMTRLPPRSREDFDKFLDYWHIDRELKPSLSDFVLLGYTGGALPRDGFRFMPIFPSVAHLEFVMEVAGHRYQDNACELGEAVRFVAETDNVHDPETVAVVTQDGRMLGHVMHGLNHQFSKWLISGQLSGEVVRINGTTEQPVVLVHVEFERHTGKLTKTG